MNSTTTNLFTGLAWEELELVFALPLPEAVHAVEFLRAGTGAYEVIVRFGAPPYHAKGFGQTLAAALFDASSHLPTKEEPK